MQTPIKFTLTAAAVWLVGLMLVLGFATTAAAQESNGGNNQGTKTQEKSGGDKKDDKQTQTEENKSNNPENKEDAEKKDQADDSNQEAKQAEVSGDYAYRATRGDSLSKLSRKAIQTYGIENGVNLSGAQIVAAETNLTNQLGGGWLAIGQEIRIPKETVKKMIEQSQKLSDQELSAWNEYVPLVDFNTNDVGEVIR